MTDHDLLESIRAQFADVQLGAPLDEVLARGRELRLRGKWLPALGAGTSALATVTALTFALAAPGGQPPMLHADLTAWSVRSGPDRTVSLTIRNQRESRPDRERLSRALRAVGVPAVVRTALPASCKPGLPVARRVITFAPGSGRHGGVYRIKVPAIPPGSRVAIVVPAPQVVIRKRHGRAIVRLPENAPLPVPRGLPTRKPVSLRVPGPVLMPLPASPGGRGRLVAPLPITVINPGHPQSGKLPPDAIAVPPVRKLPLPVIRISSPRMLVHGRVRLARPKPARLPLRVFVPQIILISPGGKCSPSGIMRPTTHQAGHGGA